MNKILKKLIFIFICIFAIYPLIAYAGSYTLDFEHHNYRDTTIEYKYVQIGSYSWSSQVSSAVSRWNNASVTYASKPKWAVGSLSYDEMIFSDDYGYTGWDGSWISYPAIDSYDSNGHPFPMSAIDLNDWYIANHLITSDERIAVTEHEMGHELGLGDVDDDTVIMYSSTPKVYYPTTADLQGVASKCTLCNAE